jgi:hypothetical protein
MTARLWLFSLVTGFLFSAAIERILHKKRFLTIRSKPARESFTVFIKLSDAEFGGASERDDVCKLEDALIEAIEENSAGEFDGNEFGGGFATLYMYGPSATKLEKAIMPVLTAFHLPAGSYAVKCYEQICPGTATALGDTRSVQWRICRARVGSPRLCSARVQAGALEWMLPCSCLSRVSHCLHVGANDIANSADFGVAVDFVDGGLLLAETVLQGFDCDIEPDFVPELEAVGHGLCG